MSSHIYVELSKWFLYLYHYLPDDNEFFERHILLIPCEESLYSKSIEEFLEIVSDGETNGMEVHYIGGKLYYSYTI